ncbi:MAG: glycosyltransferase [Chloroflexi bacterium]|nr:glycosyltransferase [Chloroflexota bacterium]
MPIPLSTEPQVSAVIPVYNGTNFLSQAIDSVLAQTFADYELIVVDDGSTDETWALIQSYGSRVRAFRKSNGGVASALNFGIREMRGRWFAWLSHDDLWMPQKLETQLDFLRQNPRFKACYTDYYVIDAQGRLLDQVESPWFTRVISIRKLFESAYINGSTMVIERDCLARAGPFSENLKYTQDTEMWLRLLREFEIGRVPEKLVKQRRHPAQDSIRNHPAQTQETVGMYLRVFEEQGVTGLCPGLVASPKPRDVATAYTWLAETVGLRYGAFDFADRQLQRAVQVYPNWQNPARFRRAYTKLRSLLYHARATGAQLVRSLRVSR